METERREAVRLVLMASEYTLSEYWSCLEHLLAGLADESVGVALVCPPGWDVERLVFGYVEVIRYPAVELPLLGRLNRRILFEQLVKFKPTLIHCLCEGYASLAGKLSAMCDVPYVLSVNSLYGRCSKPPISGSRCAKIIAPAESIAANTAATYPRFVERIKRINPGAFAGEGRGSMADSGRLVSIVMRGPYENPKEVESVFAAAKRLVVEGYEFVLVIITGQAGDAGLWQMITKYGLSKIATIVPRLEPWRPIMEGADIFVRAQAGGEYSCMLLEAMASGTAVAACKGGVDDLVLEGQTAAVFEAGDELSVSGVLKGFLDRREDARKLAAAAQEYVRQNHSVSKMVEQMLLTYQEAMHWYEATVTGRWMAGQ